MFADNKYGWSRWWSTRASTAGWATSSASTASGSTTEPSASSRARAVSLSITTSVALDGPDTRVRPLVDGPTHERRRTPYRAERASRRRVEPSAGRADHFKQSVEAFECSRPMTGDEIGDEISRRTGPPNGSAERPEGAATGQRPATQFLLNMELVLYEMSAQRGCSTLVSVFDGATLRCSSRLCCGRYYLTEHVSSLLRVGASIGCAR